MAIEYQRNTWETGKVITAKALNDIETGIVNIVEKLNGMDGEVASQTLKVEGNASIGGTAIVTGKATFNGPVEIKGATTISGATAINNDITVSANQHIILLESSSESPNENNYVVTKGYVDGQISTINNKTINSGNTGIVSSGKLGVDDGITITLQPATAERLGGIKVGSNLTINETGVLNATDTTYALASTTADGLMSKDDFEKLKGISANATSNTGTVTGVKINDVTKNPTDGTVDIGNIVTGITMNNNSVSITNGNVNLGTVIQDISSKANLNSPTFTGQITLGDTSIEEPALQKLNGLPQIPSLADNAGDGIYVLQASKTTPEGATKPVITYSWIPVPEQESGGEGS